MLRLKVTRDKPREPMAWGMLALFGTFSTLLCCALPIVLVALGLGAVVASLTWQFPILVTLAEYKAVMFGVSATLLGLTAWSTWGRKTICPTDPRVLASCHQARTLGRHLFWLGGALWLTGFFAAYLLLPLSLWLGL